jgi:homogentisate 1,2-dioxygenase
LYGNKLDKSNNFRPRKNSFKGEHRPHGGFSDGYVSEMKIQTNRPRKTLEGEFVLAKTFQKYLRRGWKLIKVDQMTIMIESSRTFL